MSLLTKVIIQMSHLLTVYISCIVPKGCNKCIGRIFSFEWCCIRCKKCATILSCCCKPASYRLLNPMSSRQDRLKPLVLVVWYCVVGVNVKSLYPVPFSQYLFYPQQVFRTCGPGMIGSQLNRLKRGLRNLFIQRETPKVCAVHSFSSILHVKYSRLHLS